MLEVIHGARPIIRHLVTSGCKVLVHTATLRRDERFDRKAKKSTLTTFCKRNAYRVLLSRYRTVVEKKGTEFDQNFCSERKLYKSRAVRFDGSIANVFFEDVKDSEVKVQSFVSNMPDTHRPNQENPSQVPPQQHSLLRSMLGECYFRAHYWKVHNRRKTTKFMQVWGKQTSVNSSFSSKKQAY